MFSGKFLHRLLPVLLMTLVIGGLSAEDPLPEEPALQDNGLIYLSEMDWVTASNANAPVKLDRTHSGGPITIEGVVYEHGLGVHATSKITYDLGGRFLSLVGAVGIDDRTSDRGAAIFKVTVDGQLRYTSPVLTGNDAALPIAVDVTGANTLVLELNANGTNYWDHGDWADIALTYPAGSVDHPPRVSIVEPTTLVGAYAGAPVHLEATADDVEDGAIPDAQVTWYSDIDGQIGTGLVVEAVLQSPGRHQISVVATDSAGNQRTADTKVLIDIDPNLPDAVYWRGDANDPSWSNATAWSTGLVPTPGQSVILDSDSTSNLVIDQPVEVTSFYLLGTYAHEVDQNADVLVTDDLIIRSGPWRAGAYGQAVTIAVGGNCSIDGSTWGDDNIFYRYESTLDLTGSGTLHCSRELFRLRCAAAGQVTTMTRSSTVRILELGGGDLDRANHGIYGLGGNAGEYVWSDNEAVIVNEHGSRILGNGRLEFYVGSDGKPRSFHGGDYDRAFVSVQGTPSTITMTQGDLTCHALWMAGHTGEHILDISNRSMTVQQRIELGGHTKPDCSPILRANGSTVTFVGEGGWRAGMNLDVPGARIESRNAQWSFGRGNWSNQGAAPVDMTGSILRFVEDPADNDRFMAFVGSEIIGQIVVDGAELELRGDIHIKGNVLVPAGQLTIRPGDPVVIDGPEDQFFALQRSTFHDVHVVNTVGRLFIAEDWSLASGSIFQVDAGARFRFLPGAHLDLSTFIAVGTEEAPIELLSKEPDLQWQISAVDPTVRHATIRDSQAVGALPMHARYCEDLGNNERWVFTTDERAALTSPLASYENPIWVEGVVLEDAPEIAVAIDGQAVATATMQGASRWHVGYTEPGLPAGILLDGVTTGEMSVQMGTAAPELFQLEWLACPLDGQSIGVRKNGALRFEPHVGWQLRVQDANGEVVHEETMDVAGVLSHQFTSPGSFYVYAVDQNLIEQGGVQVEVLDLVAELPVAIEAGYGRKLVVPVPKGIEDRYYFESGNPKLEVVSQETGPGIVIVYLRAMEWGDHEMLVRVDGPTGPVLTRQAVQSYVLEIPPLDGMYADAETTVGNSYVRMIPFVRGVKLKLRVSGTSTSFRGGCRTVSFVTGDIYTDIGTRAMLTGYDELVQRDVGIFFFDIEVPAENMHNCFGLYSYQWGHGSWGGTYRSPDWQKTGHSHATNKQAKYADTTKVAFANPEMAPRTGEDAPAVAFQTVALSRPATTDALIAYAKRDDIRLQFLTIPAGKQRGLVGLRDGAGADFTDVEFFPLDPKTNPLQEGPAAPEQAGLFELPIALAEAAAQSQIGAFGSEFLPSPVVGKEAPVTIYAGWVGERPRSYGMAGYDTYVAPPASLALGFSESVVEVSVDPATKRGEVRIPAICRWTGGGMEVYSTSRRGSKTRTLAGFRPLTSSPQVQIVLSSEPELTNETILTNENNEPLVFTTYFRKPKSYQKPPKATPPARRGKGRWTFYRQPVEEPSPEPDPFVLQPAEPIVFTGVPFNDLNDQVWVHYYFKEMLQNGYGSAERIELQQGQVYWAENRYNAKSKWYSSLGWGGEGGNRGRSLQMSLNWDTAHPVELQPKLSDAYRSITLKPSPLMASGLISEPRRGQADQKVEFTVNLDKTVGVTTLVTVLIEHRKESTELTAVSTQEVIIPPHRLSANMSIAVGNDSDEEDEYYRISFKSATSTGLYQFGVEPNASMVDFYVDDPDMHPEFTNSATVITHPATGAALRIPVKFSKPVAHWQVDFQEIGYDATLLGEGDHEIKGTIYLEGAEDENGQTVLTDSYDLVLELEDFLARDRIELVLTAHGPADDPDLRTSLEGSPGRTQVIQIERPVIANPPALQFDYDTTFVDLGDPDHDGNVNIGVRWQVGAPFDYHALVYLDLDYRAIYENEVIPPAIGKGIVYPGATAGHLVIGHPGDTALVPSVGVTLIDDASRPRLAPVNARLATAADGNGEPLLTHDVYFEAAAPAGSIEFEQTIITVDESAGEVTLLVKSNDPTRAYPVDITYTIHPMDADPAADLDASFTESLTGQVRLPVPTGSDPTPTVAITLPIAQDGAGNEGSESFAVSIVGEQAPFNPGKSVAVVTIRDTPSAPSATMIGFDYTAWPVDEPHYDPALSDPAEVPISLSYSSGTALTQADVGTWHVVPIDVTLGDDIAVQADQTIDLADGIGGVPVRLLNDTTFEVMSERFLVWLEPADPAVVDVDPAKKAVVVAITETSPNPSEIRVAIPLVDGSPVYRVGEEATSLSIPVIIDNPIHEDPLLISYTIEQSTAELNQDFLPPNVTSSGEGYINGVLEIAPGQASASFDIVLTDDLLYENSESFNLRIESVTNASLSNAAGTSTYAKVVIEDDETRPTLVCTIDGASPAVLREGSADVLTLHLQRSGPTERDIHVDLTPYPAQEPINGFADPLESNDIEMTPVACVFTADGPDQIDIQIRAADDDRLELTEVGHIVARLRAVDRSAIELTSDSIDVIIESDDAPPRIALEPLPSGTDTLELSEIAAPFSPRLLIEGSTELDLEVVLDIMHTGPLGAVVADAHDYDLLIKEHQRESLGSNYTRVTISIPGDAHFGLPPIYAMHLDAEADQLPEYDPESLQVFLRPAASRVINGTDLPTEQQTFTVNGVDFYQIYIINAELDNMNYEVLEDHPLAIDLAADEFLGPYQRVVVKTPPARGQLTGTGASYTYMPLPDTNGDDSFVVEVFYEDYEGAVERTVNINVLPVQDRPIIMPVAFQRGSTPTRFPFDVRDPDTGETLSVHVSTMPKFGNLYFPVDGSGLEGEYTPIIGPDYNHTDRFWVYASDGHYESVAAHVTAYAGDDPTVDPAGQDIIGTIYDDRHEVAGQYDLVGGIGNDRIIGLEGDDRLIGDAGDDQLDDGPGADELDAGPGNDVLGRASGAGFDDLAGNLYLPGLGYDLCWGSRGPDTYRYTAGDGFDIIEEAPDVAGITDRLEIAGAALAACDFYRQGDDLQILLPSTADRLLVRAWYTGAGKRIETIVFTDSGETADPTTIDALVAATEAPQPGISNHANTVHRDPVSTGAPMGPTPVGVISQHDGLINNLTRNYLTYRTDFPQSYEKASALTASKYMQLSVRRVHRYGNRVEHGSFGLGVYSNFDHQLILREDGGDGLPMITYFDVEATTNASIWEDHVGASTDLDGCYRHRYNWERSIQLLDDAYQLTADQSVAAYAELLRLDGMSFLFEIIDTGEAVDGVRYGRLISVQSPEGLETTITYQFARDAAEQTGEETGTFDRSQLWNIDYVTDPRGRRVDFIYGKHGNRWFIERLAIPAPHADFSKEAGKLVYQRDVNEPDMWHNGKHAVSPDYIDYKYANQSLYEVVLGSPDSVFSEFKRRAYNDSQWTVTTIGGAIGTALSGAIGSVLEEVGVASENAYTIADVLSSVSMTTLRTYVARKRVEDQVNAENWEQAEDILALELTNPDAGARDTAADLLTGLSDDRAAYNIMLDVTSQLIRERSEVAAHLANVGSIFLNGGLSGSTVLGLAQYAWAASGEYPEAYQWASNALTFVGGATGGWMSWPLLQEMEVSHHNFRLVNPDVSYEAMERVAFSLSDGLLKVDYSGQAANVPKKAAYYTLSSALTDLGQFHADVEGAILRIEQEVITLDPELQDSFNAQAIAQRIADDTTALLDNEDYLADATISEEAREDITLVRELPRLMVQPVDMSDLFAVTTEPAYIYHEQVAGSNEVICWSAGSGLFKLDTVAQKLAIRTWLDDSGETDPEATAVSWVLGGEWDVDAQARVMLATDSFGNSMRFVYASFDGESFGAYISEQSFPDGSVASQTYQTISPPREGVAQAPVPRLILPNRLVGRAGYVTEQVFNDAGQMIEKRFAPGTRDEAIEQWTYEGQNLLTHVDPNGNVTDYYYDDFGSLNRRRDPADVPGGDVFEEVNNAFLIEPLSGEQTGTINPMGVKVTSKTLPIYENLDFVFNVTTRIKVFGLLEIQERTYDEESDFFYPIPGRHVSVQAYPDESREISTTIPVVLNSSLFNWSIPEASADNLLYCSAARDRNDNLVIAYRDSYGREVMTIQVDREHPERSQVVAQWFEGLSKRVVRQRGTQADVEHHYDGLNRLVESSQRVNDQTVLTTAVAYDGVSTDMAVAVDAYGRRVFTIYDRDRRPIRSVRELVIDALNGSENGIAGLERDLLASQDASPRWVITDMVYNAAGQVIRNIDGRGVVTAMIYDQQGRLAEQVEAYGSNMERRTRFEYDAAGNLLRQFHPRHFDDQDPAAGDFITEYTYTGRNLLASVTEAVGRDEEVTRVLTYTKSGQLATETDWRGHVTTNHYDTTNDRLERVVSTRGTTVIYAYDKGGRKTDEYLYDVYEEIDPELDPVAFAAERYVRLQEADIHRSTTYDAFGREVRTVLHRGDLPDEIQETIYDDYLTQVDSALIDGVSSVGSAVLTHRIEDGQPVEQVIALSDGAGRVVRSRDAGGNISTMTYDGSTAEGLVKTLTTDAAGRNASISVDAAGQTRVAVDAAGFVTTTVFDAAGQVLRSRDALGNGADQEYDILGRLRRSIDTAGYSQRWDYDAHDNQVRAYDYSDQVTETWFDARNRAVRTVDRLGNETRVAYDANGNKTEVVDAENNISRFTYGLANELLRENYDEGDQGFVSVLHEYDGLGNQVRVRRQVSALRDGPATTFDDVTYAYDAAQRLARVDYLSDGSHYAFTYDLAGRPLTTFNSRYGVGTSLTYDAAGRQVSETLSYLGQSFTVGVDAFDALNRPQQVRYPDGSVLASTFTARGGLQSLTFAGQAILADKRYDAAGRPHWTDFGNGLSKEVVYETGHSMVAELRLPGVEAGIRYGYDANKRIDGEIFATRGDQQIYDYDLEDRLTRAERQAGTDISVQNWLELSPLGNWSHYQVQENGTTVHDDQREHSKLNEVTREQGVELAWDYQGNQLNDRHGRSFAWDQANRLTSITAADGSQIASYAYDTSGRRIAKRIGDTVTVFVHSGDAVIADYDLQMSGGAVLGVPALQRSYIYAGANMPVAMVDAAGVPVYLHANLGGSPVAVTDQGGAQVAAYRYDPYGQRHVISEAAGFVLPIGLAGHRLDLESGLIQMRQRYYDPERGGFISRDYLRHEAGMNWSLYASGNPINRWDRSGLWDQASEGQFVPGPNEGIDDLWVQLGRDLGTGLGKSEFRSSFANLNGIKTTGKRAYWVYQDKEYALPESVVSLFRDTSRDGVYVNPSTGAVVGIASLPATLKFNKLVGSGNVSYVPEPATRNAAAATYERLTSGHLEGRAPAVGFDNPNPKGFRSVKFDGIEVTREGGFKIRVGSKTLQVGGTETVTMIDRKFSTGNPRPPSVDQINRQALALRQNGQRGVWEVTSTAHARQVRAAFDLAGASDVLSVRVVPAGPDGVSAAPPVESRMMTEIKTQLTPRSKGMLPEQSGVGTNSPTLRSTALKVGGGLFDLYTIFVHGPEMQASLTPQFTETVDSRGYRTVIMYPSYGREPIVISSGPIMY